MKMGYVSDASALEEKLEVMRRTLNRHTPVYRRKLSHYESRQDQAPCFRTAACRIAMIMVSVDVE
jgi:hypothetical protein